MKSKSAGNKRGVMMSDKYLSESGLQGGKVIGQQLWLGSFIIGIPLLIIGLIALIAIAFDMSFPSNTAVVIASVLIFVIGLLLVFGGYGLYRSKKR